MKKEERMIIRKAKREDISSCLKIQELDKDNEWTDKNLGSSLKNKGVIFLVAEDNKKIIGYMIGYFDPCMPKDVIIQEVRVNRLLRNRGIGTKIVNAFCRECKNKGAKNISALIQPQHLKFYIKSCKFKRKLNWIAVSKD